MRDDDDQVDRAVRNLAPEVPAMSETNFTAGRDRVLADAARGPDALRRRKPARRWIGAAAAVTVLTAGAVAMLNFGGSGPAAEAVEVLTDAADVTVNVKDTPLGPGQYRYVKKKESRWSGVVLRGASSANCWFRYERTEETWIPADWNQEWLRRTSRTDPLETKECTKDEAMRAPYFYPEVTPWEARAKKGMFSPPDLIEPPGRGPIKKNPLLRHDLPPASKEGPPTNIYYPTPEFLAGLPRDPQQLFVLLRDSACLADACAFMAALDMLGTGQIPGELRAAVYRAMTRIPGMTVADRQANLDGRTGIAIRITDPGRVRDMIIDTRTGDYIGRRFIEDSPAGKLFQSSAVTTGVADAMGAPPKR